MDEDLFRALILDHYQNPRNRGRVEQPDVAVEDSNPFCGDSLEVSFRVQEGLISDIGFEGRGCTISQASASMMAEHVKGRSLEEADQAATMVQKVLLEETLVDSRLMGPMQALAGVTKYPVRVRCALLPWNTLREGMKIYRHDKVESKNLHG